MSKFAEKLQHSYKTVAPLMGFHRSSAVEESPAILLVADITKATAKAIKDIISCGADSIVVNGAGVDKIALNKINKNGGQVPAGLIWDDRSTLSLDDVAGSGMDFIIFDLQTTVETMNKEGLGKFLKIDSSLIPGMVKAINDLTLTVDGVIVNTPGKIVTIESLLVCKLFSDLLSKPLLFSANSKLSYSEIECLYNAGVNAILLPPGIIAGDIAEMKKSISTLPRITKKKSSVRAMLPGIPSSVSSSPQQEDPEEEDDDDI
jgi:hypothetical protein